MTGYIGRRLLFVLPVLFAVSVMVFALMRFLPGDAVTVLTAEQSTMTEEQRAEMRRVFGLDRPAAVAYVEWLAGAIRGDFGRSLETRAPVSELILAKLPVTIELTLVSVAISLMIAFPIGIYSALRANTVVDTVCRTAAVLGMSMPNFWFAILLLLLLSKGFGWLPPYDQTGLFQNPWANAQQMALPALTLGWTLSASTMRMIRATMLDTLRQEYLTTARAKGLANGTVVVRHALPNALIPVVTVVGLQLGALLGGAVVIEQVFALPGVGWLLVGAIGIRDYPVVQGAVLFLAAVFVLVNLIVDIAYAYLDPRIRYAS
jgi:peptide/nickel transport system permease protein